MSSWQLAADYQMLQADFGSLQEVFALEGERITHDPLSELIRVNRKGVNYYVKRYRNAGKGYDRKSRPPACVRYPYRTHGKYHPCPLPYRRCPL